MKIRVIAFFLAVFVYGSASALDGSALVATAEWNLPGIGPRVATNAFPKHTLIEITNVVTGLRTQAYVVADLGVEYLLALVSPEAAELIGMDIGPLARISLGNSGDAGGAEFRPSSGGGPAKYQPLFLEREFGGYWAIGDVPGKHSDYFPAEDKNVIAGAGPPEKTTDAPPPVDEKKEPPADAPADAPANAVAAAPAEDPKKQEPAAGVTPGKNENLEYFEDWEFVMVESEERPPETLKDYGINPEDIISGIGRTKPAEEPVRIIPPPIVTPIPTVPSLFPVITRLEPNKYYVQLAAYSRVELVNSAVSRIDGDYRKVVCVECNDGRLYRLLLGPLNQGESGAVLARFKSIGYKDAFIRQGK